MSDTPSSRPDPDSDSAPPLDDWAEKHLPNTLRHLANISPQAWQAALTLQSVTCLAGWTLPNPSDSSQHLDPLIQQGDVSHRLTLAHRQQCLQQIAAQPHQPLVLSERPLNSDTSASKDVSPDAMVAMVAMRHPQVPTAQVLEIQFRRSTDMQRATEMMQRAVSGFAATGWRPFQATGSTAQRPLTDVASDSDSNSEKVIVDSPRTISPPTSETTQGRASLGDDLQNLSKLSRRIHQSLDPLETDLHVCNELVTYLDVDRVSVARWRRGHLRLHAISGQPSINRRSAVIQMLEPLIHAAMARQQNFLYPTDEPLPKEIRRPLDAYLLASQSRSICICPVMDQAQELSPEAVELGKRRPSPPRLIAALILESLQQEKAVPQHPQFVSACELAGDAVRNSYQHQQLLFYPLWHWLGRTRLAMAARRLPVIAIVSLVVLVLVVIGLWPVDFYVSCEGVLVPRIRQRVYAPSNALVDDVLVQPQQEVTQGMALLQMKDHALDEKIETVEGQIENTRKELAIQNLRIKSNESEDRFLNRAEETPLAVLEKELANLLRQRDLLQQQKAELTVVSRIDGRVITWQVDQELLKRPVPFGRLMMEVAQVDGPWQLELNLPDRRVGHLLQAKRLSEQSLRVEFVLAARPDQRYQGHLVDVADTTTASQVDGNYVRLLAQIDSEDIAVRQNETQVTAKVYGGRSTLAYLWLHDIGEFLQKKIFFFTW